MGGHKGLVRTGDRCADRATREIGRRRMATHKKSTGAAGIRDETLPLNAVSSSSRGIVNQSQPVSSR
jgi:hypothetical protein